MPCLVGESNVWVSDTEFAICFLEKSPSFLLEKSITPTDNYQPEIQATNIIKHQFSSPTGKATTCPHWRVISCGALWVVRF